MNFFFCFVTGCFQTSWLTEISCTDDIQMSVYLTLGISCGLYPSSTALPVLPQPGWGPTHPEGTPSVASIISYLQSHTNKTPCVGGKCSVLCPARGPPTASHYQILAIFPPLPSRVTWGVFMTLQICYNHPPSRSHDGASWGVGRAPTRLRQI